MTATIMIHNAKPPISQELGTASSLTFPAEGGGYVAIFMPHHVAEAMAAAYAAATAEPAILDGVQ